MTPEEQQKVDDVADMLLGKPRKWIEDFAAAHSLDYDELVQGARDFLATGDYLCGSDNLEGADVPDEFWQKFELVEGVKVPNDKRENFFTCSC